MTIPEWCDEHWMTLPCAGCRADRLASGEEQAGRQILAGATTDIRKRAAGDDDGNE